MLSEYKSDFIGNPDCRGYTTDIMKKLSEKKIKGEVKIRGSAGVIWMRRSALSILLSTLATWLMVISLTAVGIPIVPVIWYRIKPDTPQALEKVLAAPVTEFPDEVITSVDAEPWQPSLDASLPQENRILIPAIGVKTAIIEKPIEQYEEAFKKGVWRVPDFGTPFNRERATILAAHRFGYLAWTNQYRRENSFFNLPKLEVGDRVTIIWDQRKYVYEIFAEEDGKEISRYDADLILYTCRFLESDIRIFRYARLIKE